MPPVSGHKNNLPPPHKLTMVWYSLVTPKGKGTTVMGHPDTEYNTKRILDEFAGDHTQWHEIASYARKKYEQGNRNGGIIVSARGEILAETIKRHTDGANYRIFRHIRPDYIGDDAQHLSPTGHMYDLAASTYARHTGIRTAHISLWEILNRTGMNSWITCECRPRQDGSWCGRTREFEPKNPTLITTRDEKDYLDRNWAYFAKPPAARGPMPAA